MSNLKRELWRLAVLVTMARIGLLPLQSNEIGRWYPPSLAVAADPDGTRTARRKYRKLWRKELYRELNDFAKKPRRRQKHHRWDGIYIKGKYRSVENEFECQLLRILAYDVGRYPRKNARGMRWNLVMGGQKFRKELLKVASEFGLLDPRRNM